MNKQQILNLISELRVTFKNGYPKRTDSEIDKMILDCFFHAFVEDKMDRHDLTVLTNALGYGVNDEILDQVEKDKEKMRKKQMIMKS